MHHQILHRLLRAGCIALVTGFLALPAALHAQNAVLFVRVKAAANGDVISNATIQVMFDGQALRSAQADDKGAARIGGLPAGTFQVRVQAIGYKEKAVDDVRLNNGQIRVLEVELDVAPVELESIKVMADRVKIQRTNTDFSTVVDSAAITMLPVAYDPNQLIALTPGARPGHVWGGANFQANNYQIDGLSANNPGMGGDLIQPSINWIERVDVKGLGAGAEYGGFQGGLVDIITKRGTNKFMGTVRTNAENHALNATNLSGTETGTEVANRYDVNAEIRGPIVRDRLFYYLSGERIEQASRSLNYLPYNNSRYSPLTQNDHEEKYFGKLTWDPGPSDEVELSGGYLNQVTDNDNLSGYQAPGAATRLTSPTSFANFAWRHTVGSWANIEARVNHMSHDERQEPYAGEDVPGQQPFALTPPYAAYANAPFRLRSAPSSTSAKLTMTFRLRTGSLDHLLKVGADYTYGSYINQRLRNGGMTWAPISSPWFDPTDPSTWSQRSSTFVPSDWGGEVNLNADVANTAVFAQSAISLGKRVVITPGIRWGQWQGWMNPQDAPRFLAVQHQAIDPRIGAMVELNGNGSLVLKAHWGRYHQNMITQMFDRVGGSHVFTNEELWYYWGDPRFTDPTTSFTQQQRDQLAQQGLFTLQSVVSLNETGPVMKYRQPYVDQWLAALEYQASPSVKLQALYTRRTNHDMIALVDLNRATNYVRYDAVRVLDASGGALSFNGGTVVLPHVYIPTAAIIWNLKLCAAYPDVCGQSTLHMPPGFTLADTANLTWDPRYVLTTAPDAYRNFGQLQLSVDVARPTWGGSFSVTFTSLRGNLDNVSGYTDPTQYGAGPYVHVNEGVNDDGILPNFADREAKVSVWGMLPGKIRGGLFFTYASGDHYTPQFRLTALGLFRYKVNTGPTTYQHIHNAAPVQNGDELDVRMFKLMEGDYVYIGPHGGPELDNRARFDGRIEREIQLGGFDLGLSLDVFNIFDNNAATQLNTMVNNGQNYYYFLQKTMFDAGYGIPANQYYKAVLQRVSPRTFRFGVTAHF